MSRNNPMTVWYISTFLFVIWQTVNLVSPNDQVISCLLLDRLKCKEQRRKQGKYMKEKKGGWEREGGSSVMSLFSENLKNYLSHSILTMRVRLEPY